MRKASLLAVAGLVTLTALQALAQTNPYRRYSPLQSESYQTQPTYSPRATNPYSHPPGYQGIIRWNTPNADGNFGGPGAGGASIGG